VAFFSATQRRARRKASVPHLASAFLTTTGRGERKSNPPHRPRDTHGIKTGVVFPPGAATCPLVPAALRTRSLCRATTRAGLIAIFPGLIIIQTLSSSRPDRLILPRSARTDAANPTICRRRRACSCSRAFLFDSPSHAFLPCRGVVVSWGGRTGCSVLLISSHLISSSRRRCV
jgi:hypothetical protein